MKCMRAYVRCRMIRLNMTATASTSSFMTSPVILMLDWFAIAFTVFTVHNLKPRWHFCRNQMTNLPIKTLITSENLKKANGKSPNCQTTITRLIWNKKHLNVCCVKNIRNTPKYVQLIALPVRSTQYWLKRIYAKSDVWQSSADHQTVRWFR